MHKKELTSLYALPHIYVFLLCIMKEFEKKIYSTTTAYALFNEINSQTVVLWRMQRWLDNNFESNLLIIFPSLTFQRRSLFRSYSPPKIIECFFSCFLSQIWRQNALLSTLIHTAKELWHSSSLHFLSLVYLMSVVYLISLLNLGC